jgi:hypothetical protein
MPADTVIVNAVAGSTPELAMSHYRPLLNLFIVWHPDAENQCQPLAQALYQAFNRDPDHPMARGIGIPTYFRSVNQPGKDLPSSIDLNTAEHTVILVLGEASLVNDDAWGDYLADYYRRCKTSGGKHLFLPVALSASAFNLHPDVAASNFVRLFDMATEQISNRLLHFVTHALARLLDGKQTSTALGNVLSATSIKLFISHTKREPGALALAKALKAALENTQMARFFDSVDIASGHDFAEEIAANIEQAALLAIRSDRYSESPWCRMEVLWAKRYNRPIVVVDALKLHEYRSFPYMSNVPVIRFDTELDAEDAPGKLQAVIDFALLEVLRIIYQKRHLENLQSQDYLPKDAIILSRPPEPRDLHQRVGKHLLVYPDPPLGVEEADELTSGSVELRTPTTLHDRCLQGLSIGLSISNVDAGELQSLGLSDLHLQDAMLEIARHCLAQGATLVYGGDLRPGGFTENLLDLVRYHNDALQKRFSPVRNFLAWPLHQTLDADWAASHKDALRIVKVDAPEDLKTAALLLKASVGNETFSAYVWARSLTTMRENLVQQTQARILVGGRTSGYKGKYPGLVEEAFLTLKDGKPLFLLGGFGGAAQAVIQALQGETPEALTEAYQCRNAAYQNLMTEYNQTIQAQQLGIEPIDYPALNQTFADFGINGLNNGLSKEENRRLFETQNLEEAIGLILAGLTRIRNPEK